MLQSKLFSKTQKSNPKDEEARNAQLLIRAGFIRKNSSGVYSYLPLGLRVLKNIMKVVREEIDAIGGQELLMPSLVAREYWTKTERWNIDIAYKLKTPAGEEFALGWTHEEVISSIANHFIRSYKDLPLAAYQIQTKFRSEPRAKSGILRGREFIMKDLYSFHTTKEDLDRYYVEVAAAYEKIFQRLELNALYTEAGGGAFTKEYTHEFQVPAETGEDVVFYCTKCRWAQNKEIALSIQEGGKCPKCKGVVAKTNAIEVGNIFRLGTKYSAPYQLYYVDENGERRFAIMGSYGIGISRLMGTMAEVSNDERGLIWPRAAAPFTVHLLCLQPDNKKVFKAATVIYNALQKQNIEVLFDDRIATPGEKFNDADLIGIPLRAVVSEKTVLKKKIEIKERKKSDTKLVSLKKLITIVNE